MTLVTVMVRLNETERLQLMFKLLDRVPDGIEPMLACLETHIYQVARGLVVPWLVCWLSGFWFIG